MESELSPDKERETPPVPIKTYQWEDLRRARDAGGYPWTHLLKIPLEGEITADDIIRETTPRRSMSRDLSRSRTHSPIDRDVQRILNLDSSPGSSRKHGEDGEDDRVQIPNFSKEVSLDSEDEAANSTNKANISDQADIQTSSHLVATLEVPKNVSPKGILKRRVPEQQYIGATETREKTKCCHPLVNKIKHLADKTLHKLERNETEKSPVAKRKKNEEVQEIKQLKSSPGAVRRQKFGAIKLGDSDEMSKSMAADTPPPRKKKEHIYEDILEKNNDPEKIPQFSPDPESKSDNNNKNNKFIQIENESYSEKRSNASQDPSLVSEDIIPLKKDEQVMEKLHKKDDINKEAVFLDEEMDPEEPNVDEIFQNQLDETRIKNDSPNITITEIIDDDMETGAELNTSIPIETSPSPSPRDVERKKNECESDNHEWSRPNSDHEYEIIEKPSQNIVYNITSVSESKKPSIEKRDDELSSTTSLERKYLHQNSDDDDDYKNNKENYRDEKNEDLLNAETLQKDLEDRYFVNTPSTISRTECEISTSQADSSALENLPLKRGNRSKNAESIDHKIQQKIKEGTGKLKFQAGKLKSKIQNMKTKPFTMPERPKMNFMERSKIKLPDRPKFSFPDRPKFSLPDRRKFSLPDRPKFKKINISDKLSFGDRKFTFPDRPKFNVPDLPKFKIPDRPKINFPSLSRKKESKQDSNLTESSSDLKNVPTVEFEAKTYPRLFGRKKKSELPKTSSSPTLNREDTPPPTFNFTRIKKSNKEGAPYIPDSPEQPREYGNIEPDGDLANVKQFNTSYGFDKLDSEYVDDANESNFIDDRNAASTSDISPYKLEYTHINELNNDEFFVRPRGISRENIQVREYLSDEIRQAFKIPKNVLALMGSNSGIDNENVLYANEPEADPELMIDENEIPRYSPEDLNDKDDGYYTFPPVRPSRAKRKKKDTEPIQYIDDSINVSMQFSEVDLGLLEEQDINIEAVNEDVNPHDADDNFCPMTDLHSIHEYANDDVMAYPEEIPIQSQTLPMPPKRKKKVFKNSYSSLNDFKNQASFEPWEESHEQTDIIVYRTEHEYIVPQAEITATEPSPIAPRRNRSRSSRCTSLNDDDRTSQGADSLTLDTHLPHAEIIDLAREIRQESPGYATVDKGLSAPLKVLRRSRSKTPPVRRRKSSGSEAKYHTVGSSKGIMPDRPPRKKSSTSLVTLDSLIKKSVSVDLTQYVEIDEPHNDDVHKDLKSGEVVSKMKDRPLPPPPRPPRVPKREKKNNDSFDEVVQFETITTRDDISDFPQNKKSDDIIEIEVSTQTDPLPEDVDFELGVDEHLDMSITSSLRDIIDEETVLCKNHYKISESPRVSRPTSRSEKSLKLSDPKISELSKFNIGRTSPTVILVERRVSSPTRINERDEMLTEASLTVQHIDIDESQIPDVPPLPNSKRIPKDTKFSKNITQTNDDRALERVTDSSRDVMLDNLVTQRLQVRDLDVGRLNVSELQASKILVSDIEGMTLQVTELDSKSGHISVSGIEFSQSVIDEIVKKFAEITTIQACTGQPTDTTSQSRSVGREEETQTDEAPVITRVESKSEEEVKSILQQKLIVSQEQIQSSSPIIPEDQNLLATQTPPTPPPRPVNIEETPQRPPPPDLTPLLYSYLHDMNLPGTSFYSTRPLRDRPFTDFHETHQSPPPPTRRPKRKPATRHSESSSDESIPRPSPRRMPPPVRAHEQTITEAGAQFLRVCHSSITRTIRSVFNSFISYISGSEDKKDMQMALVIFLVLIAGLIMFGLSDSRTVHHHHWEFFNPPDSKQ